MQKWWGAAGEASLVQSSRNSFYGKEKLIAPLS